ncbi:Acetolactate synthase large subunit [Paenibacillaceae bacterium GAS479]|nr:Acetolactate synthase large subunit [Paenibacillaceae bacterium GAS479]
MNGSDSIMTVWAAKGLRQLFYDRTSETPFNCSLIAAARKAGISVHGRSSLLAALSAAEGYALASDGVPAAAIGTSAQLSHSEITAAEGFALASLPLLLIKPSINHGNPASSATARQSSWPFKWSTALYEETAGLLQLEKSYYLAAGGGRRGPVLVELPPSLVRRKLELPPTLGGYEESEDFFQLLDSEPPIHDIELDRIMNGLFRAKCPLFVVGGGVRHSGASAELKQLMRLTGIPAAATPGGLDTLPIDDSQSIGLLLPNAPNARTVDYVLALGCKQLPYQTAGACVDIDIRVLPPGNPNMVWIQSDIRLFLTALIAHWAARGLSIHVAANASAIKKSPEASISTSLIEPKKNTAAFKAYAVSKSLPTAIAANATAINANQAPVRRFPGTVLLARREQPGLLPLLQSLRLQQGQRLLLVSGASGCEYDAAQGVAQALPDGHVTLLLPPDTTISSFGILQSRSGTASPRNSASAMPFFRLAHRLPSPERTKT